uniref:ovomucoid-like n=1 Tax=Odobenus rosmarus divergens TaxID=9708 RepID=UPI00063CD6ED|nr:PREDICTED: ovomucoid-like [Odobenus rosmarus divergens]
MKIFFVAILATSYFSSIFGHHLSKDIPCGYYQRTSIQKKHICSIRVSPLCASNNVTYSNTCVYCFANIALKLTLRIQYNGRCRKTEKVWDMT